MFDVGDLRRENLLALELMWLEEKYLPSALRSDGVSYAPGPGTKSFSLRVRSGSLDFKVIAGCSKVSDTE